MKKEKVKYIGMPRAQILKFIKTFTDKHKIPPSKQEVADALECNVNNITHHYNILRDMGLIDLKPRMSRGVFLKIKANKLISNL